MVKRKSKVIPRASKRNVGDRSTNAIDQAVGRRVRVRRLELKMSQERLADLLGVTFQQIQKYEKGVNRIAASRLFAVAAVLEKPVGYFFEGLHSETRSASVAEERTPFMDEILSTPEGVQLIALFSTIKNAQVRRHVVALVRAVADEAQGQQDPAET